MYHHWPRLKAQPAAHSLAICRPRQGYPNLHAHEEAVEVVEVLTSTHHNACHNIAQWECVLNNTVSAIVHASDALGHSIGLLGCLDSL